MGVIEMIYFGKICPFEEFSKKIPEFSSVSARVSAKCDALHKTLSEEQEIKFIEYDTALEELYQLCEKQSFIEGFKLGAKIIEEIAE